MNEEVTPMMTAPDNTGVAASEETLLKPQEGTEATDTAVSTGTEEGQTEKGEAPLLDPNAQEQKEEEPAEEVPESYEDFKLPDGFQLEGGLKESTHALFKGLGLTQTKAQQLIDFYTRQRAAEQNAAATELVEQRKAYRAEVRQRPTFQQDIALSQKGMKALLNTPEAKALFTDTWLSDHPVIFDLFVSAGRLVSEDNPIPASSRGPEVSSYRERFPIN